MKTPGLSGGAEELKAIIFENKTPFDIIKLRLPTAKRNIKRRTFKMNDVHSLSHSKWNCKYHIVFAPKYRRKVFYEEKRQELGEILRTLCKWYGVNIIEGEVCPDHIHMLVEIPPKHAVFTLKQKKYYISHLCVFCCHMFWRIVGLMW